MAQLESDTRQNIDATVEGEFLHFALFFAHRCLNIEGGITGENSVIFFISQPT